MSFDSNSLQSLCFEISINADTLKEAEKLCNYYTRNNTLHQPFYLYIASIIAAVTITKNTPPDFYVNIFKNLCAPDEFIEFFKSFIKSTEFPTVVECEEIIQNYSFSWRLYKKFLEKWAQLELEEKQGYSGVGTQLRDFGWILIALKRNISPSSDLVENACLIIGVLYFILTHLPNTISFTGSKDPFEYLINIFNGNCEESAESCQNINNLFTELKVLEIVRCNSNDPTTFEGIFSATHLNYNFTRLNEHYLKALKHKGINESEFIKKSQPKTPVKNIRHRKNPTELKSKRIISWDHESTETNMKTKLTEIPVSASPCQNSFTPMSSAMEFNNWLRDLLKRTSLTQLPILLQEYDSVSNFSIYAKLEAYRNKLSAELIEKENMPSMLQESTNKPKTESILKLYVYSLHGMIKNEQKRQGNLSTLYGNENFHQATFACSIECIAFFYGLNLNFEQVLALADVSVFEFWKLITTFVQFDQKMPLSLKKHFKDVENHILNENAWNDQSPIRHMLNQYVIDCKASSGSPIFSIFFKRLLSFIAQKLVELTDQLDIIDEIKEKVWELIKMCITEQTELIYNRTLDTIILCSIYAVCKTYKPISFKTLIENFSILNPSKEHVFKQIAGVGDIIKFYNHYFIPRFKDYLSQGCQSSKTFFQSPLRASLPITSPSRSPAFCSPKTPYLTPRTRKLWASSETSHTLMNKKGRLISFDDEPQLPKIEEDSPSHRTKK